MATPVALSPERFVDTFRNAKAFPPRSSGLLSDRRSSQPLQAQCEAPHGVHPAG